MMTTPSNIAHYCYKQILYFAELLIHFLNTPRLPFNLGEASLSAKCGVA